MSMRRVSFNGLLTSVTVTVMVAVMGAGGCASGQPPDGGDCGNGRLDPGELCDATNLGGFTCETLPGLGFTGGELACSWECSMDTSGCTGGSDGVCGNDVMDGTELCDGEDLGGETCESQGMVAGTLLCDADCLGYDMIRCTVSETCGNGLRDGPEECDQSDLAGATCEILGYLGGTLDCLANCLFDESGCGDGTCGNSVIEGSEECDATDLGGETCVSRGFGGGPLACSASCTFDEALCGASTCGDGTVDPGEECDGSDFGGADCVSEGFTGGTLACDTATCAFDTTGCSAAVCGDGTVDAGEECDGSDFGSQDCVNLGFGGGSLTCTAACAIDTAGCTSASCGDGTVDAGEECDDGNTGGGDGCSATCTWENTCSQDDTLTCGQTISNVSGVSGNDVSNNSCNGWGTGSDRVYAFTATANGNANASINCHDFDMDYDMYILQGACNPVLCLDHSTGGSCDSVSFPVTTGITYYIVVEYYMNSGFDDSFDISLSCS